MMMRQTDAPGSTEHMLGRRFTPPSISHFIPAVNCIWPLLENGCTSGEEIASVENIKGQVLSNPVEGAL